MIMTDVLKYIWWTYNCRIS